MVEYRTPAATEGLGTRLYLAKSHDLPINGVAILDVSNPKGYLTLVHVAVRLPKSLQDLTSDIVRQTEADGLPKWGDSIFFQLIALIYFEMDCVGGGGGGIVGIGLWQTLQPPNSRTANIDNFEAVAGVMLRSCLFGFPISACFTIR